ncbi:Os11g0173366 [Oryza sativa Japonica Group]|uniref:Os11g0173366 protein n=1 Tax=Oryza sativa subsp. japonica TaxID=39947 RepID=A0A0P0XZ86_ORYSJ|nr:Os11g0173366 [Oryza sativa Japonica Group]
MYCIVGILNMSSGTVPSKLLFEIPSLSRASRFPKLAGSCPLNLFEYRKRWTKLVRLKREDGMSPVKLLSPTVSFCKLLRAPSQSGRTPEKRFPDNSITTRL